MTTFAHINIRGLRSQKHQLTQFLTDNNIDILSLNETNLTNKILFKIPNYITYNQNSGLGNSPHTGVALLIKDSINSTLVSKGTHPHEFITVKLHSPYQ